MRNRGEEAKVCRYLYVHRKKEALPIRMQCVGLQSDRCRLLTRRGSNNSEVYKSVLKQSILLQMLPTFILNVYELTKTIGHTSFPTMFI